jgi:tetratricopeptide (TPR) repeat protein
MSLSGTHSRGQLPAGILLAILLSLMVPILSSQESELSRTRKIAEAQHDIVMILIKKKEFAKAEEEANKIFQLKWPEDQESVLKDELLRFSDLFRHDNQPAIALQLLEKNMGLFKNRKIKADVLKDKAYLLEGMGQHDSALECFREAKLLLEGESQPPPKQIKK